MLRFGVDVELRTRSVSACQARCGGPDDQVAFAVARLAAVGRSGGPLAERAGLARRACPLAPVWPAAARPAMPQRWAPQALGPLKPSAVLVAPRELMRRASTRSTSDHCAGASAAGLADCSLIRHSCGTLAAARWLANSRWSPVSPKRMSTALYAYNANKAQ